MTDFPDVPDVPGVPTVPRDPNTPSDQPALLSSDSVTVTGYSNLPKWGLLLKGKPAIDADSIVNFEYKKDWTIADYQIEEGQFASYDKVAMPYDARMTFARGGSEDDRADFLTQVSAVVESIELYEIVTPEISYANANAAHWDYRRTNINGVGLIQANIYFVEIRVTAAQNFSTPNESPASQSDVQDPGAASQVNDGAIQAQPASTAQNNALKQGLEGFADAGAAGAL